MTASDSTSLAPYALTVLAIIYAYLARHAVRALTGSRSRRGAERDASAWARKERTP